jgi:hypothetical protein
MLIAPGTFPGCNEPATVQGARIQTSMLRLLELVETSDGVRIFIGAEPAVWWRLLPNSTYLLGGPKYREDSLK